jgi:hypothetical protein
MLVSETNVTDEPMKPVSTPDESTEISRREFMKGAAAAGVVIGADEYVKPTLKMLGVSRLASAASTPPPPPPPPPQETPKKGCTPGFWGNNSSNGQGGGVSWWNTSSDPDWSANGAGGTQPFSHGTLFTSVFTSHALLVGATMWDVVNGGGGEQPARRAARQLVAAYLNASFGSYAYTRNQLRTMWTNAVQGGNSALNQLNVLLDTTNNACDQQ